MKQPKATIFNLARTAPVHAPLRDLLQQLESFEPPTKTVALVVAEEDRRKAGQERDRANKELAAMCAVARKQADGEGLKTGQKRVSANDLLTQQQLVADLDRRLEAAKESEGRVSLEWRRSYTQAVFDAVGPARIALHDLLNEIESAMTLFRELARRASAANAGSPRILQEAPTMLEHLRIVREFIDVDRRILP